MKAKVSLKSQLWITSGVIVGSIVAASAGIYFLLGSINTQAEKIVADKTLAAGQAASIGILAKLKSDASVAAQYTTAMNKLVPTHDELIGVPQWLDGIAATHNVTVSFSFQGSNAPASGPSPGTDNFSMSVDGSAGDIVAFVDEIETQAPEFLLAVNSFDLTNNGSDYRLSAQGVFFSRPSS